MLTFAEYLPLALLLSLMQTPPSCTKPSDFSFHFTSISAKVTQTMLQHLNIRKSTGLAGLSGRFLKEFAFEIVEPLSKLYNISLQSGCIPQEWKHCNVTVVHKSGPQQDPSNFHLLLVVPVIAKTLEKIIANQLSRFFESNKLLSPFQDAYQRGKSTEQILLYAVDTIVNKFSRLWKSCVHCVFRSP